MLFGSYIFIFCFLPVTLIGYFLFTRSQKYQHALSWLVLASLFFYGWWNPKYLLLLLLSISVNYWLGSILIRRSNLGKKNSIWLFFGVFLNLLFIGYFKYTYFLLSNLSDIISHPIAIEQIVLPLGISFFTFQKIAFLVDASRGEIKSCRFHDYCLFVTFFPQLIAGPIVQHKQIIPQLSNTKALRITSETLTIGLSIFFIGLFKKIALADTIAVYANAVFDAAAIGTQLSIWEAWCGAFAYALQLYFDFSGYSDMAIGLGYLFGIKLPINFNSPYQARSIIDFWRRWHMTLSTFLKDYLYIPLGGNQNGSFRRYLNLFLTMLIGGLWHGANWTFVLWGGLHGVYLILNHAWRWLCQAKRLNIGRSILFRYFAQIITLLAVVVAWVPFRAENISITKSMWSRMFSLEAISLPHRITEKITFLQDFFRMHGIQKNGMFYNGIADWYVGCVLILFLLFITLWMPNTIQLMSKYAMLNNDISKMNVPKIKLYWQPTLMWASAMAFMVLITIMLLSQESEFLYFQF